ncbi:DUF6538 domain-containing protein [Falsiroseomonas selenitidurans]|uniref:DUF6538 domain-containing protein n=1 Tax=Falsiroseomonas selenitidurans TaxID=2716335 RepID=UPI002E2D8B9A|nr:DUF6538 domain-containing protein [Falsiroseomonas selenitidurans]
MPDTRWIEQRRQGWYCVKEVPRPLREVVGRARLVKSLGTRSLGEAQLRRWAVLADWERQLAVARRKPQSDALADEALAWREEFARVREGLSSVLAEGAVPDDEDAIGAQVLFLEGQLVDRARGLEASLATGLGAARAKAKVAGFFDTALGRASPLDAHVEAWLAEGGKNGPVVPSVALSYRRAVAEFSGWCAAEGRPTTLEAVTRASAGAFASHLLTTGRQRPTLNNIIAALSAYWTWLGRRRGFSTDNPWKGQMLAEGGQRGELEQERPFSDAEVALLLSGPADPVLADAMRIAALSGMRIAELHELRVSDCADGAFRVKKSKTANGAGRHVPMHPDLALAVARLSLGKAPEDYLLPGPAKGCRYDAISDRFRRYQKARRVYDKDDGRRRSVVNWHSWRRWFVMKAERAGVPETTVALVVGHKRAGITFGIYSRDADALWDLKVACVEAVKLPPLEDSPGAPTDSPVASPVGQ